MSVYNSGLSNGTNVIQQSYTGGSNQRWKVTYVGDGYYVIRPSYSSTLALDVYGATDSNYSPVCV